MVRNANHSHSHIVNFSAAAASLWGLAGLRGSFEAYAGKDSAIPHLAIRLVLLSCHHGIQETPKYKVGGPFSGHLRQSKQKLAN